MGSVNPSQWPWPCTFLDMQNSDTATSSGSQDFSSASNEFSSVSEVELTSKEG